MFFIILIASDGSESDQTSKDQLNNEKTESSVEQDNIYHFLKKLTNETGIEFSAIEDDEITWPAERISLNLSAAKSFTAKNMDENDFISLVAFFNNLNSSSGGIGFTYTADSGGGPSFQN